MHCGLKKSLALYHFIDDCELGDVCVSLLTIEHCFAFVHLRTFFLMLKWIFCQLILVWRFQTEITQPLMISTSLLLILVKQSVT